jgi:hypothetical protein
MPAVLAVVLAAALSACSSMDVPSTFPIAQGPLQADEIPMEDFANVKLAAGAFDVVSQDMTAERNTGLAGAVSPMPVDILSSYAAQKFRANGGFYNARFVIRQAQFQVRSVREEEDDWSFFGSKVDMTATVTAMLALTRGDGLASSVTVNTTQTSRVYANTSPDARREAYMELMTHVVKALDAELTRQMPLYIDDAMAR